ncbi:MAG: NYN domain-containing protein, partial [Anaerolineae bacterium]|nr:NYN domain-containing protein [Anaerolineae bacterium]
MAAYLIVDVDDLIAHFRSRNIALDLQELAVGLRGGAALAAGLVSADRLRAVAAANWKKHRQQKSRTGIDPQYVFKAAGYEIFDIPHRESLADALIIHYFSFDPEPVDELILATTNPDLIPLVRRVKRTRNARVRMWGSDDVLEGTEFADQVIFQPLESLLGIQQTKNVAIYVDFENIAISLNEQGYIVNLDTLIESLVRRGKAHGQVVKIEAYAPWTQRGSLPPLVDLAGREIADDATNRLLMADINPVITLPGKNSADMKMSNDILRDVGHEDAADIYIVASGDRDFKDMINQLRARNKTVIIWSVHGSTSRQLENNPNLTVEYIEDFTNLQTHQSLSLASMAFNEDGSMGGFTPSQWSSVIIQFDRLAQQVRTEALTHKQLIDQLIEVGAVVSQARGEDLVSQAVSLGILRLTSTKDRLILDYNHPVVEKTCLIR